MQLRESLAHCLYTTRWMILRSCLFVFFGMCFVCSFLIKFSHLAELPASLTSCRWFALFAVKRQTRKMSIRLNGRHGGLTKHHSIAARDAVRTVSFALMQNWRRFSGSSSILTCMFLKGGSCADNCMSLQRSGWKSCPIAIVKDGLIKGVLLNEVMFVVKVGASDAMTGSTCLIPAIGCIGKV